MVFFLKSRSLCGTLHRPSMSWGKSSWTRLINKRNESRWKESTGPSRNWSMQSGPSLLSATGRRALINSQGWPAEAPWPTYRQAKDRAGLLLLNSKPWQLGPVSPLSWGPSAGFHGDSTEIMGRGTQDWVYPLKAPTQAVDFIWILNNP